jgi:hypothetical protein
MARTIHARTTTQNAGDCRQACEEHAVLRRYPCPSPTETLSSIVDPLPKFLPNETRIFGCHAEVNHLFHGHIARPTRFCRIFLAGRDSPKGNALRLGQYPNEGEAAPPRPRGQSVNCSRVRKPELPTSLLFVRTATACCIATGPGSRCRISRRCLNRNVPAAERTCK